jgi:hypothetical protein
MNIKTKYSEKILYLLFYYLILLLVWLIWAFRSISKYGGDFSDVLIATGMFFPITLTALILPPIWILRKKTIKEITITSDEISYNQGGNNFTSINPNHYKFRLFDYNFYSILILYKITTATRGHKLETESIKIIGTKVELGWTPEKLNTLSEYLQSIGMRKSNKNDEKSFLYRVIE